MGLFDSLFGNATKDLWGATKEDAAPAATWDAAPTVGPTQGAHGADPVKEPEPLAHPKTKEDYEKAMGEFNGVEKDPQMAAMQQLMDITRAMTNLAKGLTDGSLKPEDATFDRMMDHEKAKHELADKFEIVGDDFKGEKHSNTVSEDEYRKVAATYSDIRQDKADLKINPDFFFPEQRADAKNKAMDDIGTMMQTAEGRAVVERLANNTAAGDVGPDGQPLHHTTTLMLANYDEDNPHADGKERRRNPDGSYTTKGTNSELDYSAGHTLNTPKPTEEKWAHQERSDVTLFHEMVHAVHQTDGSYDADVMADSEKIKSDAGKIDLRRDEYKSVGLNGMSNTTDGVVTTENAYREARNHISKGAQKAGDGDFVQRSDYYPIESTPPAQK
jgi:NleD-like pathogen effector protein (putative zinc metallopeptidase)